jgi:hypothetical protein
VADVPAWFDRFTDGIAAAEGHYLVCETCGEAALPPREVCPACAATTLGEEPLPDRGTVLSFTEISVTIPKFHGETPYTVVLAEFDDAVALTGQLRGAGAADVTLGDMVAVGVEDRGDEVPVVTFRRAE